jgi:hypothetical protein
MTSRDFCYWLQGYLELSEDLPPAISVLNPKQIESIKKHLNMVFHHEIDPGFKDIDKLKSIHNSSGTDRDNVIVSC